MDRPHNTNFVNPRRRSYSIMLSLCQNGSTNVLLLLHPVSDQVALAFPATRKVKSAEGALFWEDGKETCTFEAVRPVTMHEEDAE